MASCTAFVWCDCTQMDEWQPPLLSITERSPLTGNEKWTTWTTLSTLGIWGLAFSITDIYSNFTMFHWRSFSWDNNLSEFYCYSFIRFIIMQLLGSNVDGCIWIKLICDFFIVQLHHKRDTVLYSRWFRLSMPLSITYIIIIIKSSYFYYIIFISFHFILFNTTGQKFRVSKCFYQIIVHLGKYLSNWSRREQLLQKIHYCHHRNKLHTFKWKTVILHSNNNSQYYWIYCILIK